MRDKRRAGRLVAAGVAIALAFATTARATTGLHGRVGTNQDVFPQQEEETPIAVSCRLDEETCGRVQDNTLYLNASTVLHICVSGDEVDTDATTVEGEPLADLLAANEEDAAWYAKKDEEGSITYEGEVALAEGCHAVADLCRAQDCGEKTVAASLTYDGASIEWIVVDKTAPRVVGTVAFEPAYLAPGQETVAYFAGDVELCFAIEDASGVANASFLGENTHELVLDQAGSTACCTLSNTTFGEDETLVVSDLAGNVTTWSLRPKGTQTTAEGFVVVANTPVRCASTQEPLVADGTLRALVADGIAPIVQITGVEEGASYAAAQTARITVFDQNLASLVAQEPSACIARLYRNDEVVYELLAGSEGVADAGTEHTFTLDVPADVFGGAGGLPDGSFEVRASVRDLSGNRSGEVRCAFVIDTVAPRLRVVSDQQPYTADGHSFGQARTMRICLVERNATLELLEQEAGIVKTDIRAWDGGSAANVVLGPWVRGEHLDEFYRDVEFLPCGTYELSVRGADLAGNVLVGDDDTVVDEDGIYRSDSFVVDDEPPRIVVRYAASQQSPAVWRDTDYFAGPVTLDIAIEDHNVCVDDIVVKDDGRQIGPATWTVSERDESGRITCKASVVCNEREASGQEYARRVSVRACDVLGNAADVTTKPFVVDMTPPQVTSARASKAPFSVRQDALAPTSLWLFNELLDPPTSVTLEFYDACALDEAWVVDARGVYSTRAPVVRGATAGHLTIDLKDPIRDRLEGAAWFGEDVVLFVRDIAGNLCSWSLAEGNLVPAETDATSGAGPYDSRPSDLVLDATPPRVELFGIDPGCYSNKPLVAHLVIDEYNFDLVRRFDPARVVATVDASSADVLGTSLTSLIRARDFDERDGRFCYDQRFDTDGHYTVEAAFADLSGNESNHAILEPFTVDMTPPIVRVSWDVQEVRNQCYYRAYRTATIEVTEHNFDPSLVDIETTGVVAPWTNEGDVHLCQVVFDRDSSAQSPHTLKVRATDRAQNVSDTYEELPFVIDTCPPTVELLKRTSDADTLHAEGSPSELADGCAFAGAFEPQVACADNECLDAAGIEVSMRGMRSGSEAVPRAFEHRTQVTDRAYEVFWDNLGLVSNEAGDAYDANADDVYVLTACVSDMAGNMSEAKTATFSLNRFGSNFYVESVGSLTRDADGSWPTMLLVDAPAVTIHEVNVSGADAELGDEAHLVTKEHAFATKRIDRNEDEGATTGYSLTSTTSKSTYNPVEGWVEYTYLIYPGNFGLGSDTDFGDGGQGHYSVNVGSLDQAHHVNSSAGYWSSAREAADSITWQDASVSFTLDEIGPKIEDVSLPPAFMCAQSAEVTFFVVDEFTEGDSVRVFVDGEPVEVRMHDTGEALSDDGQLVREGMLAFTVEAKPLWCPRSVEICVSDYTNQEERTDRHTAKGFCLTTLWQESVLLLVAMGALITALLGIRMWQRSHPREKGHSR